MRKYSLIPLAMFFLVGMSTAKALPLTSYDAGESWAGVSVVDSTGQYVKVRKERAGESADWLTIANGKFWTPIDSIVLAKADGSGVNLLVDFKSLPDNDTTLTVGGVSIIGGKTYQQFTFTYADGDTLSPMAEVKSYGATSVPEPMALGMAVMAALGVVVMRRGR